MSYLELVFYLQPFLLFKYSSEYIMGDRHREMHIFKKKKSLFVNYKQNTLSL